MKNKTTIAFTILIILTTTLGCGLVNQVVETDVPDPTPEPSTPQDQQYSASNLERDLNPEVDADALHVLSKTNTAFALKLYEQISSGTDNLIFSPFSISLTLSMTMAGAENSTEKAMMDALQMVLPEGQVHPSFNALLLAFDESADSIRDPEYSEGQKFQLNIANSIWGQAGLSFKTDFLDTLALQYGAGIYQVDYLAQPESARLSINQWVEEETEERIKDLIPPGAINEMTRLVLANAIYFNGSWMVPFNESRTSEMPFNTLDETEIIVDMMSLSGERLSYYRDETYQAVRLPYYSSDFSMLVVVPNCGSFQTVENQISSIIMEEETLPVNALETILDNLSSTLVDLKMPKFDFESNLGVNDPLKALGMEEAFNPNLADFSGMTEEQKLYISSVLHKANITVDENGTEAAAATAVIMTETAMEEPEEPISLVIDRPFMFFILHNPTRSILFMGRVTQP